MFSKLSDRFADIPDWSEARCNLLAKSSLQATCRFYYIIFYYFINICNLYMTSCEMKCCKSYKRIATCCLLFIVPEKIQTNRQAGCEEKDPQPLTKWEFPLWQKPVPHARNQRPMEIPRDFFYNHWKFHFFFVDPWNFHVIFYQYSCVLEIPCPQLQPLVWNFSGIGHCTAGECQPLASSKN